MFDFIFQSRGICELILILVIVLCVFGARKVPIIGKALGKCIDKFYKANDDCDTGEKTTNAQAEPNKPNIFDVVCYFIILVLCYFSFNHADILVISSWSFTYLYGHITDFYEVNKNLVGICNYFPSCSILFAIWNIPLKLLGFGNVASAPGGYFIFWYKLLPTLFLAGSAYYMYKIGKTIGLSNKNSKLLTILWVSSPILFFSQFIFGQTDIFTTFFMLMGLYYFLKKREILSALFFGISFTFKYFPLLIYLPLLLSVEKKPARILSYLALSLIPISLEFLFYANSPVFRSEILGGPLGQNISPSSIISGSYIFVLILLVICGLCYYRKTPQDKNTFYQNSFYICLVVCCIFALFISWNPQWLLFITPFLIITTFLSKRIKYFLVFDFLLMVAFIGFTVLYFQMNVDQSLLSLGILGKFNPNLNNPETVFRMAAIFNPLNFNNSMVIKIYLAVFSVILVLNTLLKYPGKQNMWEGNKTVISVEYYWNWVRLRFLGGIAIFVIPAFIAYFYTLSGFI